MIEDIRQSTGHGIRPICNALGVPRSSYYHAAQATLTQQSDQQIGDTLKAEMLDNGCFINARDAQIEIFAYIDSYYNLRKHSVLNYQTPAQFEAEILTQN